jgi:hypothetical protein
VIVITKKAPRGLSLSTGKYHMLEFILGSIVGLVVGWKIADWLHMGTLIMILKEFNITEEQIIQSLKKEGIEIPEEVAAETPAIVTKIKVEQHGDQLYAFTVDTDQFLAQGADPEDLAEKILAKVPKGGHFECREDQGGKFFTLLHK